MTGYTMQYCNIEKKVTAHKVYWSTELEGLKVRHYATFLCGHCQYGLIDAYTKGGIFHQKQAQPLLGRLTKGSSVLWND